MATQLFYNNLQARLQSSITAGTTTFSFVKDDGTWPSSIPAGQYLTLTIGSLTSFEVEIVHVTAITATTMTVLRGQEGTTAIAWSPVNSQITARLTAEPLRHFVRDDQPVTFTDLVTFYAGISFSGGPTITAASQLFLSAGFRADWVRILSTGTTSFSTETADDRGITFEMSTTLPEVVTVYLNGVKLIEGTAIGGDFDVTPATSTITLAEEAPSGSVIEVVFLASEFSLANTPLYFHDLPDINLTDEPTVTSAVYNYDAPNAVWQANMRIRAEHPPAHSGVNHSVLNLESRPVGSGTNGPGSADRGLIVSSIKEDWDTSSVAGELDGVSVMLRQGGPDSGAGENNADAAGYLANIANVGTCGWIGGFEMLITNFTRALAVEHQIQLTGGVINVNDAGGPTLRGFTASAKTNDGTYAFSVTGDWEYLLYDPGRFEMAQGDMKLFDNWSVRTTGNLFLGAGNVNKLELISGDIFRPVVDDAVFLGDSSHRFQEVHSNLFRAGPDMQLGNNALFFGGATGGMSITNGNATGGINFGTNNMLRWNINVDGTIIPLADNAYDLGSGGFKLKRVFTKRLWAGALTLESLPAYPDNATAVAAVGLGGIYRTGGDLKVAI